MEDSEQTARRLIREFFRAYPDYALCQALAENISNGVTTHSQARDQLARKARAARQNGREIAEKLDARTVMVRSERCRIKDLSLHEILNVDDATLAEILQFYFKHPFAHGRTYRSRLLPHWLRTVALRAMLGHARSRNLELDYPAFLELIHLL